MADLLTDFPYRFQNGPGNTPDADEVMADYDHIRDYLNGRLGNLTNGQLLIANASGQVVGRTISGDVTVSTTGVTTIGAAKVTGAMLVDNAVNTSKIGSQQVATSNIANDAVTNAKMADNAVDTAQVAAGAITNVKLDLAVLSADDTTGGALTSSYASLASLGVVTAGDYLAFGVVSFATIGGTTTIYTRISGDANSEVEGRGDANSNSGTAVAKRVMDGSTALAVQGRIDPVVGVAGVYQRARIVAIRVG